MALRTPGGQDRLPESAWLLGKAGLVMGQVNSGRTSVFQLSHPGCCPSHGANLLTLGERQLVFYLEFLT